MAAVNRRGVRRRALLCGLAALSGCAGVLDGGGERSRETVAPSLRGTPAPPPAVAWAAEVDADRLYPAGDAVVAVQERDGRQRHVALATADGTRRWTVEFDDARLVYPGETLVVRSAIPGEAPVVGLDPATGERLWSREAAGDVAAVTGETVVTWRDDPTRTVAYDRADGERRWESPPGERPLRWTTDPVVTVERVGSTAAASTDGVRLRGRAADDGTVAWAVTAPDRVNSTERVAGAGDRQLFADEERYYVLDTATEAVVAEGDVPAGVATGFGVTVDDSVVFGDRLPGGASEPPARLGRVDLGDGTATAVDAPGLAVRPRGVLGDRVVAARLTADGARTTGVDPQTLTVEWDTAGVPLDQTTRSVVVATPETVGAHGPDGSVRWRAERPVGERLGVVGSFDDRTAYGVVSGGRVVVVGDDGVVSWDATDGERRTATTAVGAETAWTLAGDTVVVAGDRLSAVRI